MTTYGTLYGIGVGPGDPELMTVKAVKLLSRVRRVFAASSTKNDASIALAIASGHLSEDAVVEELGFPMTRDAKALAEAWERNANQVRLALETGEDAVFLTLGDPLLYSTFGYLLSTLRRSAPDILVRSIPGVTSFQAAASLTMNILAESGQGLHIVSGVCDENELRRQLQGADNVVILKAYRNLPCIKRVVSELGMLERSLLATRVGQEGESVVPLAEAPERPHYFSLVLIGPRKV